MEVVLERQPSGASGFVASQSLFPKPVHSRGRKNSRGEGPLNNISSPLRQKKLRAGASSGDALENRH